MPVTRGATRKFEPWPLAHDPPSPPRPPGPPRPENRPATGLELLAFVVFAGTMTIGFSLALYDLLPIDPAKQPGTPGNWLGQPATLFYPDLVLLLILIYAAKWVIICRVSPSRALIWYALVILASLSFIWFFLVLDWFNTSFSRLGCWIGYPLLVWMIPTATFFFDWLAIEAPATRWYVARSGFELTYVFPVWFGIWMLFSGELGWTWISQAYPR